MGEWAWADEEDISINDNNHNNYNNNNNNNNHGNNNNNNNNVRDLLNDPTPSPALTEEFAMPFDISVNLEKEANYNDKMNESIENSIKLDPNRIMGINNNDGDNNTNGSENEKNKKEEHFQELELTNLLPSPPKPLSLEELSHENFGNEPNKIEFSNDSMEARLAALTGGKL